VKEVLQRAHRAALPFVFAGRFHLLSWVFLDDTVVFGVMWRWNSLYHLNAYSAQKGAVPLVAGVIFEIVFFIHIAILTARLIILSGRTNELIKGLLGATASAVHRTNLFTKKAPGTGSLHGKSRMGQTQPRPHKEQQVVCK